MPIFSLLADPTSYHPTPTENMKVDGHYREYWLAHFERHFDLVMKLAIETYGPEAQGRAQAAKAALVDKLHQAKVDPASFPELNLLVLDELRQQVLRANAIPDPFEKLKVRENKAMLPLYPQIISELDSHPSEAELLLLLVEGMFAGNIFDLGAGATAQRFASSSPDFFAVRSELGGKRPWLVDGFDAFARRMQGGRRHRKCIFFLDNAGSDTILGVVPFCRWLARRGTTVCLAANDHPALNDMTYHELAPLLKQIAAMDPVLKDLLETGRLRAINSGGTAPLIDLRRVSNEVNREAADADLVVLEGMGRALESNFTATFKVDALKVCMIKEQIVADRHGGKLFDVVCRFDPAG